MTSGFTTSRYPRVELTVIPAFNEARRIADTVGRVARELEAMALGWELIVVNDGSADETSAMVRERACVARGGVTR